MSDSAPLSVKRLLEQVKARLEPSFAAVCVVGEVSNFRGSGKHWYFTLKEEGAALSCAVWASQQRFLQHKPADGQRVVLKGSLNLYVAGGTLTLAVTHCEPAGVGDARGRPQEHRHVEAVARQPWVLHGKVGMVGLSYSGISQLYVASTNPPHLAAVEGAGLRVRAIREPRFRDAPDPDVKAFRRRWGNPPVVVVFHAVKEP